MAACYMPEGTRGGEDLQALCVHGLYHFAGAKGIPGIVIVVVTDCLLFGPCPTAQRKQAFHMCLQHFVPLCMPSLSAERGRVCACVPPFVLQAEGGGGGGGGHSWTHH